MRSTSVLHVPPDIRSPSPPSGGRPPRDWRPGAREARLSRYCLLWLLAAPFVGFVLAETVFDLGPAGRWELWNAALLGTLLLAPFAVGAYFGLRSVLKGYRGGWASLVANLVLVALAIGMPIWESLAG
jgi:hypothetical protein